MSRTALAAPRTGPGALVQHRALSYAVLPVLRSANGVDDYNAIDPDYVDDGKGGAWLAFGSFWGGIKMRRLDPEAYQNPPPAGVAGAAHPN